MGSPESWVHSCAVTSMLRLRLQRMLPLLAVAPLLLLVGCRGAGAQEADAPEPTARVAVNPEDGTPGWRPDKPVRIVATGGRLTEVSVRTAEGTKIEGDFNERRTAWTSRWTLSPDTEYEVTAKAASSEGRKTTEQTSFTTLAPASTIDITSVNAAGGNTYGVGIPIVVRFDKPVYNKEWVERSFEVRASEPVVGAWHWMNRQEVHFRPKEYWPTGTKVHFFAHFDGVRAARDVYGVENVDARFRIGEKRVTRIDVRRHTMEVYEDGERIKTFPISAGKPGYPTTSGTHVVFQRRPVEILDSATVGIPKGHPEYYRIESQWAVKFTFSGLYFHAAPWSVSSQGNTNVSHGCVNLSTSRAKWFYDLSRIGDIVKITGTPRDLEWGNGWTDWDISFDEYLEGSATGEPVEVMTLEGTPYPEQSPNPSPSTPDATHAR